MHDAVMRRNVALMILMVVGFMLCADILCGVAFRMIEGYPWVYKSNSVERNKRSSIRISSPIYHHDLASKRVDLHQFWGKEYALITNSLGFRDRSTRDIQSQSEFHRIVMIGDSFTEGVGVNYEDSFVGIIDRALSLRHIEVLNAGVCSYSPLIYWKKIEYLIRVKHLQIDEAVVFIDISDIQDEAKEYRLIDGRVTNAADKLMMANSNNSGRGCLLSRLIDENTIATTSIKTIISKILKKYDRGRSSTRLKRARARYRMSTRDRWTYCSNVFNDYGRIGLETSAEHMDCLFTLLRDNGIKLTVVVYPWPRQIERGEINSMQVQFWKKWCDARGVNFQEYFSLFINPDLTFSQQREIIQRYFIRGDVHWNEMGHRLVAQKFMELFAKGQTQNHSVS